MKEELIYSTETENTYYWITLDHPGNFRRLHIKETECYKKDLIEGKCLWFRIEEKEEAIKLLREIKLCIYQFLQELGKPYNHRMPWLDYNWTQTENLYEEDDDIYDNNNEDINSYLWITMNNACDFESLKIAPKNNRAKEHSMYKANLWFRIEDKIDIQNLLRKLKGCILKNYRVHKLRAPWLTTEWKENIQSHI